MALDDGGNLSSLLLFMCVEYAWCLGLTTFGSSSKTIDSNISLNCLGLELTGKLPKSLLDRSNGSKSSTVSASGSGTRHRRQADAIVQAWFVWKWCNCLNVASSHSFIFPGHGRRANSCCMKQWVRVASTKGTMEQRQAWDTVMVNSGPAVHLLVDRLAGDFETLTPRLRRPYTAKDVVTQKKFKSYFAAPCHGH